MDTFFFSIAVVGPDLSFQFPRSFSVVHMNDLTEENERVFAVSSYDFILVSKPVVWRQDGVFDIHDLQTCVARLHSLTSTSLCITSVAPIGICDMLGCHYMPLSHYTATPYFGCNVSLSFDLDLIRVFVSVFHTTNISVYTPRDAETRVLVEMCQLWINQSFHKEMSFFVNRSFPSPYYPLSDKHFQRKDLHSILTYMIRQLEDTKLDCPMLYSCLFRHNYIDINI
jgi:hypothetical protein